MYLAKTPEIQSSEQRGIEMRRWARRTLIGPAHHDEPHGPFRIEALAEIPRDRVLGFRPALREDVSINGRRLARGGLEVELSPFEIEFLRVCDGNNTLGDAVFEARARFADMTPDAAAETAIALLGTLGNYDAIKTGESQP
jgi:hypothetical protein